MRFNIVSVVLVAGGGIVLYGAIKDRNPISIVQVVLQGKTPYDAKKISTGQPPTQFDLNDPSGGIIGAPLTPGMPGYVPPAPGSTPTQTDWPTNSPFPPGFPGA